ncbi:partner and localizer of BRCA2 [Rhinoderma darwinii]|uniref:partner and localizer of BRCA2 n=1 Tax=Rhinoderma darwinii TaxID=43563 RepID=UPI003F67368F
MTAACQDMESVPEKYLTLEEKTKLKERLALLKKEYKKTVTRLQRSQRAERVKTHVKKTIEEQNRLLSQELSNQDSVSTITGPVIDTSNVSWNVTEPTQSIDTPSADKERKPCVSFNLEPEILHGNKGSPPCSGSESSGQEPSATSKAEASESFNPNHCKRSRLRLNRSARRDCSESRSSRVQVISPVNSPEGQCNVIEPGSTRGSALFTQDEALKTNETTYNSISEVTRRVQVSPVCENDLGVNVLAQQHNNMEATNAPASPVFKKCLKEDVPTTINLSSENIEKVTLDTGQSQKVTTDHSTGDQDFNTIQLGKEPAQSSIDNIHRCLTDDRLPSVTEFFGGTSQDLTLNATCELPAMPHVADTSSTSPSFFENLSIPTVKDYAEPCTMEEERSPLDSCTMVEGLLFPVEYYVRTTRRMTSCQRMVDLEAVINNHLGTARKSTRGRPRRTSTSLTPLQVSGSPLSTPGHMSLNNSLTRSRRGRGRKSCPASLSSGLDKISVQLKFGSDINPIADCFQGVKGTYEEKDLSSKKVEAVTPQSKGRKVYSLGTQDDGNIGLHALTNDSEKRHVYNLRTSTKTNESSSFSHLSSGRFNLHHHMRRFDTTDFHLPDEDFGLLKLQKLKSTNLLKPFVLETTKENKKYRRAYSTDDSSTPLTAYSALLHGAAGAGTYASQRDLKLVTLGNGFPNDEWCLESNRATVGDNVPLPASKDHGMASQTFFTKETPGVFHLSPSKKNDETCTPASPVKVEEVHCDAPKYFADWESTCSNAEVSTQVSPALGSLDPELSTSTLDNISLERLRGGFVVSSTNIESAEATKSPSETKATPNLQCPPKKLTCSVLLSSSMCSVPLDTAAEGQSTGCTPGFPMLGSTPAVLSPQCSNSPAPCEEQTTIRSMKFPPEESVPLNDEDELVAQDKTDYNQYGELLLPPSGGATQVCVNQMEKKHCSHLEHDASGSHHCNTERMLGVDRLHLVSEIKETCGGGCPVDLCSVWWEFSGCKDLCIVSAGEYSVCLWRPQEVWKRVHTWNFTEMPVIQILPLSQEKNMVCVALGNLEIMEIWVLSSHPELHTWENQLVKRGHIKTAQGLTRHRLVSSSGGGDSQVVELWQLSENGSVVGSHTLVAPKDSVVVFSEVDGERNALVGSTVDNNLVLWNSVTGHLLCTFYVGNLCSDLTCLSAISDSGLLFLVVGSLFSMPCDATGSCIFKLIATNPQEGSGAVVMAYTLPEGLSSRYLEGDVKKQKAASVLTCGSIALWDLPRSHCSAVLPPDSDAPWCLVRWGNMPSCLLAGRKDGTICVFEYKDDT